MRLIVTLLVALPQLVPPGACLCGMDLRAVSPEPNGVLPQAAECAVATSACERGCCHKHRNAIEEASHEQAPPAEPADRPHEPGCPADETATDDARVSERTNPPADAPAVVRVETVTHAVAVFELPALDTSDRSQPIAVYLAHCSLLI
jgi:hypothetical protein